MSIHAYALVKRMYIHRSLCLSNTLSTRWCALNIEYFHIHAYIQRCTLRQHKLPLPLSHRVDVPVEVPVMLAVGVPVFVAVILLVGLTVNEGVGVTGGVPLGVPLPVAVLDGVADAVLEGDGVFVAVVLLDAPGDSESVGTGEFDGVLLELAVADELPVVVDDADTLAVRLGVIVALTDAVGVPVGEEVSVLVCVLVAEAARRGGRGGILFESSGRVHE